MTKSQEICQRSNICVELLRQRKDAKQTIWAMFGITIVLLLFLGMLYYTNMVWMQEAIKYKALYEDCGPKLIFPPGIFEQEPPVQPFQRQQPHNLDDYLHIWEESTKPSIPFLPPTISHRGNPGFR
jgi:hypothetical protein